MGIATYKNTRVICPSCKRKPSSSLVMEDQVCQHCADTGFINKPVRIPCPDTPEQLAVKAYAAMTIAALFIAGLIAFAVSTAYRVGIP